MDSGGTDSAGGGGGTGAGGGAGTTGGGLDCHRHLPRNLSGRRLTSRPTFLRAARGCFPSLILIEIPACVALTTTSELQEMRRRLRCHAQRSGQSYSHDEFSASDARLATNPPRCQPTRTSTPEKRKTAILAPKKFGRETPAFHAAITSAGNISTLVARRNLGAVLQATVPSDTDWHETVRCRLPARSSFPMARMPRQISTRTRSCVDTYAVVS